MIEVAGAHPGLDFNFFFVFYFFHALERNICFGASTELHFTVNVNG